jgi:aryl-alcohol dehydrogenase-like predicted oxidoreductase
MNIRTLPNHGFSWTEIGLGCWQLGGGWGRPCDDGVAQEILQAAYDSGVRFIDTADVYGGGESERSIGRFLRAVCQHVVSRFFSLLLLLLLLVLSPEGTKALTKALC